MPDLILTPSLLKGAITLRDTRYVTGACVCTLLWDTFITISDEIDLIWVRVPRIGLIPSVYLANKYISIATIAVAVYHVSDARGPISVDLSVTLNQSLEVSLTHNPPSCHHYLPSAVGLQLLSEILSKWILTLRVVALYHGEIWVKRTLWASFLISYLLCATVTIFAMKYNVENVKISVLGGVCSVGGGPKIFALIFIFPLLYEFLMTFLTFKKAIGHAHALRERSSAPLLRVLYIEKILYFVAITGTRIALVYVLVSSQNVLLGLALLWALDVVLVSRFYLEMMTIGRKGYVPTSLWTSDAITGRDHPEISIFAPQEDVSRQGSISRVERG